MERTANTFVRCRFSWQNNYEKIPTFIFGNTQETFENARKTFVDAHKTFGSGRKTQFRECLENVEKHTKNILKTWSQRFIVGSIIWFPGYFCFRKPNWRDNFCINYLCLEICATATFIVESNSQYSSPHIIITAILKFLQHFCSYQLYFAITAEILPYSLANFYCQYEARHMNLSFMRCANKRERTIWQFVIVEHKLMLVIHAFVQLLTINFLITF